jgi:hypothetical protein
MLFSFGLSLMDNLILIHRETNIYDILIYRDHGVMHACIRLHKYFKLTENLFLSVNLVTDILKQSIKFK